MRHTVIVQMSGGGISLFWTFVVCRKTEAMCGTPSALTLCFDVPPVVIIVVDVPQTQGKRDDAISGYHQALGLKPDDAFASEMLKKALQVSHGTEQ